MALYRVAFTRYVLESTSVYVEARSEAAARKRAHRLLSHAATIRENKKEEVGEWADPMPEKPRVNSIGRVVWKS